MFLQNEFTEQYIELIESAKNNPPQDEYTEKHHIIPKSLGGTDSPDNIVVLSLRDHLLAHKLLVDMTEGVNRGKMGRAYKLMIDQNICDDFEILAEEYERTRILVSKHQSEKMKSNWKDDDFRSNMIQQAYNRYENKEYHNTFRKIMSDQNKIDSHIDKVGTKIAVDDKTYNSIAEAAKDLNKSKGTISRLLSNGKLDEYSHKNNENLTWTNERKQNHSSGQSIPIEIDGILYSSKEHARKELGIGKRKIKRWIEEGRAMEFRQELSNKPKEVEINGMTFQSISQAAKYHGVYPSTMSRWIKNSGE